MQALSVAVGSMASLPSITLVTLPSLPITKVTRFAKPFSYVGHAVGLAAHALGIGEQREGRLRLSANLVCVSRLFIETPRTWASWSVNCAWTSRSPDISFVQPPVNALGKNASTTVFLPR